MVKKAIKDKCGVFGIFGVENPGEYTYLGLHNIQHRGQETCGIVTSCEGEKESKGKFKQYHGKGIVNDVFNEKILERLNGKAAIGHVRYSTSGGSSLSNAQPIIANTKNGVISIAHNGQFANYRKLKRELMKEGSIFKTTSDTEIALHKFSRASRDSIKENIYEAFKDIKPSYSIVMLTRKELIGLRDPSGIRPLVIGYIEDKNAYVLASESVAFDIINAKYIGEVEPGEIVIIDNNGLKREQLFNPEKQQKCIFECIYFSRPDSFVFSKDLTISVARKEFGRQLYRECPIDADVVIPVPDSSIDAALGYSYESKIPFDWGFVRNHYIGRTFIQPTQTKRDAGVIKKFNPNKSIIDGKRVVVVDDSIVRASTLKKLIKLLRKFGAKNIHAAISCPPYKYSCYLGIDTAETERLIANEKTIEEIRDFIGADSIHYLSKNGMLDNKHLKGEFCTYCFDGEEIIKKE
ncbi:amidophosphoribosyltransferase [Candidatus Pacearchaeota archaeon]|jgi:amidophosphoribosyltransferase|nr:amidophosphoribosyltransferase [Candidatus Pacearchaeota archaeon]|tara:strand:+ start:2104 stop:3495 length:1392 start_codon:yes stop_codon:yes gene_type:complete